MTETCVVMIRKNLNKKDDIYVEEKQMEQKMDVISTVKIEKTPDVYKIVDALNRTLKEDDLMFGLALDQKDRSKMVFTIYRT